MMPSDASSILYRITGSWPTGAEALPNRGIRYRLTDGRTFDFSPDDYRTDETFMRRIYRSILIDEVMAAAGIPEATSLIRILRNETQSARVFERCNQWLGERK